MQQPADLLVEDNGLIAADTTAILEDAGAEVFAAPDGLPRMFGLLR